MKKLIVLAVAAFAVLPACAGPAANVSDGSAAARIDAALAGTHREAKNTARDAFRHPKETLLFLGLQPDMNVVEIWPSGGWYAEILAPVLRGTGTYYAAGYDVDAPNQPAYRARTQQAFEAKLASNPEVYDEVVMTRLALPDSHEIAPPGSADLVLTFRNTHTFLRADQAEAMFAVFYQALRPGGTLGVVQHRARPGTSLADMKRTGYVTEELVIRLAADAGFVLTGRSEINANPRDTTDYPEGVWTLPPSLRLGDSDRDKYLAIGESDRMTLRFMKPAPGGPADTPE